MRDSEKNIYKEKLIWAQEVMHFWSTLLQEMRIGKREKFLVLTDEDSEVISYICQSLALKMYLDNLYKIYIFVQDSSILDNVQKYLPDNTEIHVIDKKWLDGLYLIQNRNEIFDRILTSSCCLCEDIDVSLLENVEDIHWHSIVDRAVLEIRKPYNQTDVMAAMEYSKRKHRAIDWESKSEFIPAQIASFSSMGGFVQETLRELYEQGLVLEQNDIYIWGKGKCGQLIGNSIRPRQLKGFIDIRALEKEEINLVPVYPPEKVIETYDSNKRFFISIWQFKTVCEQLFAYGYELGKEVFLFNYNADMENDWMRLEGCERRFIEQLELGEKTYATMRQQYPEDFLFVTPYLGVGDIYLLNLYIPDYLKKYQLTRARILLSNPAQRKICALFGIESSLVSKEEIKSLIYFQQAVGAENLGLKVLDVNIYQRKGDLVHTLHGLDYNTLLQKMLFLSGERKVAGKFLQEDISQLVADNHLDLNNTIILSPYANTMALMEPEIWEQLANRLLEKGYDVYTNVGNESEPVIAGTKPLFIPFSMMLAVVDQIKCFIGLRSGLCDVISPTKNKMVLFYTQLPWGTPEMLLALYGLENMGLKNDSLCEIAVDTPVQDKGEWIKNVIDFVED